MSSPSITHPAPQPAPRPRHRHPVWRAIAWVVLLFLLLLVLLLAGGLWYSTTPGFANFVRGKVVSILATDTGGRVDIQRMVLHLTRLEVEIDNLTIHGNESPQDVPYAHIDKLLVRAKIIDLFKAKIGLRLLQAEHPVFHLIVYPDGTTNQPTPKTKSTSTTSPINEVFDLAINRTLLDNGWILLNDRKIPFALNARNLAIRMNYLPAHDQYAASLHIEDITAQRASAPAVHSALDLALDLERNAAQLKSLHFTSGASKLDASASIQNFTTPHWQLSTQGAIDLRTVADLAGMSGLGPGEAVLKLKGHGIGSTAFDLGGTFRLNNASYLTPTLLLTRLNLSTSLHATQTELDVPDLKARLSQGGGVDAAIKIVNWMPPAKPGPPATAPEGAVTKPPATAPSQQPAKARRKARAVATQEAAAAPPAPPQQATIHAHIFGLDLQTLADMTKSSKLTGLGIDTQADGTADVRWSGSMAAMVADANIALTPPHPPTPDEIPVSGAIDATYMAHGGRLDARNIHLHTRDTSIHVTGQAGLYPPTGASTLNIALVNTNLNEFEPIMRSMSAKPAPRGRKTAPPQSLPTALHGQASFHGTLTGSLSAPHLRGHLGVTDFSAVLASATTPARARARSVPAAVVPPSPPPPSSPAHQTIQFDDLEADADYSPTLVALRQASLRRGNSTLHLSAQMRAHRLRHGKLAFDNRSPITADAHIHDATLTDLLAIAGEKMPVTGTLSLQAHAAGTMQNLNGGGHLALTGGEMYGQPYQSLNTDITIAGQQFGLQNLVFALNGGRLTGDAAYNLASKFFRADIQGKGFELAKFQQLQKSKFPPAGLLTFDLHASGTQQAPALNGNIHLANLAIGADPVGQVNADIHTAGQTAYLQLKAGLVGAALAINGQVGLTGDYPLQAKLVFSQLNINPILKLANVQGVNGSSAIAGTVTLSGPARTPRLMSGDADISQFQVTVQDMPISSQGPIRASLRKGVLTLQPLHITAQDTNLYAHGTADLLDDAGLDMHANGAVNLRLAQSFSTEISSSGHVDFNFDATGSKKQPDLRGQVVLTNVNFAYQAIPNGISHLNGKMTFDQDRLTLRDVTGTTGGGQVKLGGFITYQQGVYADLTVALKGTRFRYAGLSTTADSNLRLQGTTQGGFLISGNVLITRFLVGPNMDFAALAGSGAVSPPPNPAAFSNKVRLDIHIRSSPEMDFQNSFAQIAGTVDLRIRGTVQQPAVLGRITITDGQATFAGTTYQLQHGDIYFTNPVRIEPVIDMDATARIEQYDVIVGLHGTMSKLKPVFRSEPPLPEADVISLLAQGRTQQEESLYTTEQNAAGVNTTTDAILSSALNATVSSRIQKLFGVGSVKIDPTYVGALGASTARITVQENVGQMVQLTYATDVNTTAEQLIQAQVNFSPTLSLTALRDEADVFSLVFKIHRRYH